MENFPSNSHNVLGSKTKKEKEDPPKKDIQKVVEGTVIHKKTPLGRRFKTIFFGGDARNAVSYVVGDVLIPALKNMTVDATSKGIERVIYGESQSRRRSMIDPRATRVSYNTPVDRSYRDRSAMLPGQPPHRPRRQDVGDIILASRNEAELVLERMGDIIDTYDVATVADLYDLLSLPSSHVDNKWGWTTMAGSEVRQIREGYLIDLPPSEAI